MNFKRWISILIVFLMLLSAVTSTALTSFAAEDDEEQNTASAAADEEDAANGDEETQDGEAQEGETAAEEETTSESTVTYSYGVYTSIPQKLASMQRMLTSSDGHYELYLQTTTGEVAYRDTVTGQVLFSNPFDVELTSRSSDSAYKNQLLSQIIINHTSGTFNSYEECIMRGQLEIAYVDGGIRLEYAIGRLDARRLLPRLIEKSRFEENILANFETPEFNIGQKSLIRDKMIAYYTLQDPFDPTLSTRSLRQMQANFRITRKMAVYNFDPTASDSEKDEIESYIRTYCPKYTFEMLEEDHDLTEYTGTEKAPPIFHVALEYYLGDDGLQVRCPVGGLRYVESDYSINYLRVLPYFGCGAFSSIDGVTGTFDGYGIIPDGSGAIVRFSDFNDSLSRVVTQVVYGQDCSYYTLSYEHQQTVRLPVYGMTVDTEWQVTDLALLNDTNGERRIGEDGLPIADSYKDNKGFVAIIESGAEMSSISSETGGALHHYNTVYSSLQLRATDSYDISEAITAADSALISTSSSKKYVGDYTLKYIMLNGDEEAQAAGLSDDEYYEATYVGAAKAYRDYLEHNGVLTRLTQEDVKEDIPLYIESFGTIETDDTFMTFPVTVHTPLTTFDDLQTMYEELKEQGVTNVNWKLTGFFNGGLTARVPRKAKVEKNVGGSDGLEEFLSYAEENDINVYPEFDFVFADNDKNSIFNGFSKSKYLARATDGTRYATKREYSAVYQSYERTNSMVLSPVYYAQFFEELSENLSDYALNSISVSTFGGYLGGDYNSDEDAEMYLRSDSREYVEGVMQQISDTYENVMTEQGNAYTLAYVTDLLNVPLDSSDFTYTSDTIPFMGMVLHGYVNFAGEALNMVGDSQYAVLRSIENGAYPYYILSYENTNVLKLDEVYSKYYSIDYEIWKEDLLSVYNELNDALGDLQTSRITDHEFLQGVRAYSDEEWAEIQQEIADIAQRYPVGTLEYNEELALVESKYVVDNNRIVRVEYENGVNFYLNFNNYDVVIELDNGESLQLAAEGFYRAEPTA